MKEIKYHPFSLMAGIVFIGGLVLLSTGQMSIDSIFFIWVFICLILFGFAPALDMLLWK